MCACVREDEYGDGDGDDEYDYLKYDRLYWYNGILTNPKKSYLCLTLG